MTARHVWAMNVKWDMAGTVKNVAHLGFGINLVWDSSVAKKNRLPREITQPVGLCVLRHCTSVVATRLSVKFFTN